MFDFFKFKKNVEEAKDNVYKLPKLVEPTQPIPPRPEPKKEDPVTTFYRLGFTNNERVSFQMGYSEITMNRAGINSMIKMLEAFRDQLPDGDYDPDDDPDGGLPIPEEERKMA